MAKLRANLPMSPQDRGFSSRVRHLRNQIISQWFSQHNPLRKLQQQEAILEVAVQQQQQELRLRQMEEVALDVGERQLADQLFQRSSLSLFVRHLTDESPEALRKHLKANAPLVRLL